MNSSRVISAWDGDRLVGLIRVMDDSKNAPFYEKQGFKVKREDKLMEVKVFDNVTEILRDDMASTISKGCKVSIAAACFSMYAYKELKKQLESVDECRFIFTSPTFVTEKTEKQKREFYIPRLNRESSLYGTEFELKLRNEMTQEGNREECADWIRRSYIQIKCYWREHGRLCNCRKYTAADCLHANKWLYYC